ncbi:MAG TPA: hypothetical protein P5120_00950 [Spirochaetota bacterium]|nr:hypothetical protein [Spirochaetota bacterium]HPF04535.1 hypothetical protein [Spirochaetota bacterium]HPR38032.1 hypothetical protein [Spirochaetota bacterium]HRX46060.1 hypothetical protein [Spirochaetota bacterium]
MLLKKIVIIVSVIFFALPLFSAGDSERVLKSSVNPEKGNVGQQFSYTLSIAGRDLEGVKIVLPEKGEYYPEPNSDEKKSNQKKEEETEDNKAVPLYIINSAVKDESDSDGLKQITVRVDLTCYRTGVHQLPEIAITDSDGVRLGYSIPAVTIEELNKEGQPEDIEPPVELSGNYTRLIVLIMAVIAALVAGFFIFRYFRNRKKHIAVPEIKQTPLEFFMAEIERLKLSECINEGRVNDYVFGISISFRKFLSMELGFDAAEMTTGEISAVIKKYLRNGGGIAAEIVKIMEAWDLSKFAEFTLSKELLLINFKNTIDAAERLHEIRRTVNG